MTLELKYIDAEPSLKELLDTLKRDIFLTMNCHAIATIKSFDSVKQTCTAQINYDKTVYTDDKAVNRAKKLVPYPPLLDVPVVNLRGGTAGLTMPIVAGDQCLILFNDRDINNWFDGQRNGEVASLRLHAMSDAIALIGLSSQNGLVSSYDTTRATLYNGTTHVAVGASKIRIQNASKNLNTELQNLVTEIKDLITQINAITVPVISLGAPSGTPNNAATISAITTRLTTTATNIGSLLE